MTEDEPRKEDQQPPVEQVTLLPEAPAQSPFLPVYQSEATNHVISMNTRYSKPLTRVVGKDEEGKDKSEAFVKHGGTTVSVDEKYQDMLAKLLGPGTLKLFLYCCGGLAKINAYRGDEGIKPTVSFPIVEYMKKCKIPITSANKDETRKKVRERLDLLFGISMEYDGKRKVEKSRICANYKMDPGTGEIEFIFNPKMAEHLTSSYVLFLPDKTFSLDERNVNLVSLTYKLALHAGLDNNRKNGTADRISVEALLDVCPGTPDIAQVRGSDRAFGRRIRDRLERDLDVLVEAGILEKWEYCGPKNAILTDEQLNATDYKTFSSLLITFKLKDEPERTNAQEGGAAKPKRSGRPKTSKGKRREA